MKHQVPIDRLNELFVYDMATGELRRRINSGPAKAGKVAGAVAKNGYFYTWVSGHKTA